jgi:hypothetical protein
MQIITKVSPHFIEWKENIVTDGDAVKHNKPEIVSEVRLKASATPQYLDSKWKDNSHFKALIEDGSLRIVSE